MTAAAVLGAVAAAAVLASTPSPGGAEATAGAALAAVPVLLAVPAPAAAGPGRLADRLARIAEPVAGVVGATAIHVESGERVSLNGAERFPMASVYKVPIALAVLDRVDRGRLRLADTVTLRARDFRSGGSGLRAPAGERGLRVAVRRLVELMVADSDNTASDAVLGLAGGPGAVTGRLRALGVDGIDVSRSEARLMADWSGVAALPPESTWTRERLDSLARAVPPATRGAAARRYAADPRDTSTPEAMAALLVKFHRGETLSPASTAFLRRVLEATATGPGRIKGRLPLGTVVAHKTGTMGATVNDVGIITLPGGRGHVAVAVLIKGSPAPRERCERAIADIARAVYDEFAARPAAILAPGR